MFINMLCQINNAPILSKLGWYKLIQNNFLIYRLINADKKAMDMFHVYVSILMIVNFILAVSLPINSLSCSLLSESLR